MVGNGLTQDRMDWLQLKSEVRKCLRPGRPSEKIGV